MRLTHGLALWQQTTLAAIFVVIFGWALVATALHSRQSEPLPGLRGLRPVNPAVRMRFEALSLPQQIALRLICQDSSATHSVDLSKKLTRLGFANSSEIVAALVESDLVERDFMSYIKPRGSLAGDLDSLLRNAPALPEAPTENA